VRESQYSKALKAQGALKQARADIIEGLQIRLQSTAPEPIRLAIERINDLPTLVRWLKAIFTVKSWEEIENHLKQQS
jgi:hypothetical protein